MKKLIYFFTVCVCLVLYTACSAEDTKLQWGTPWDGNGKPDWLSQEISYIYDIEFGDIAESSYYPSISARVEKFTHQNAPYLSIRYISYCWEGVHKKHFLYTDRGVKTTDKKVKDSYDRSKELLCTSQFGGKDGYIPQVTGADENTLAWLQKEVDKMCNQVDQTGETILRFDIWSFDSKNHGTCFILQKVTITAEDKLIRYPVYYFESGDIIHKENPAFEEITQKENQSNGKLIWTVYVNMYQGLQDMHN